MSHIDNDTYIKDLLILIKKLRTELDLERNLPHRILLPYDITYDNIYETFRVHLSPDHLIPGLYTPLVSIIVEKLLKIPGSDKVKLRCISQKNGGSFSKMSPDGKGETMDLGARQLIIPIIAVLRDLYPDMKVNPKKYINIETKQFVSELYLQLSSAESMYVRQPLSDIQETPQRASYITIGS